MLRKVHASSCFWSGGVCGVIMVGLVVGLVCVQWQLRWQWVQVKGPTVERGSRSGSVCCGSRV